MRTRNDLEAYLAASNYRHEAVADDTWLVNDSVDASSVVVRIQDGWVVFRLKVMVLDEGVSREALFSQLLTFNASDLSQLAYGVIDDQVLLTSAHRLDTLDFEELQGTLDEFSLAVATHRETLLGFRA